MEMFLTVLLLSLLASAASAAMFAAATHGVEDDVRYIEVRKPATTLVTIPEQFFASDRAADARPAIPLDALLLQIERHIRLERAAGESFVQAPTVTSLHCRTTSPLVN